MRTDVTLFSNFLYQFMPYTGTINTQENNADAFRNLAAMASICNEKLNSREPETWTDISN